MENVKNLTSHDNGKTFNKIKESLEKEKYNIIYKILNSSEITDIPQHRERIYIVCVKNKKIFDTFNLNFKKVKKQPIKKILLTGNIDNKYYYNDQTNKIHKMIMETVNNDKTLSI